MPPRRRIDPPVDLISGTLNKSCAVICAVSLFALVTGGIWFLASCAKIISR